MESFLKSSAKIMTMYFFLFFQKAALTAWDTPVCFSKVSP